jgi:asparagine synthetase B (glutamine-hydrolysing)
MLHSLRTPSDLTTPRWRLLLWHERGGRFDASALASLLSADEHNADGDPCAAVARMAQRLEMAWALALVDRRSGEVALAVGPLHTFSLYHASIEGRLEVRDALPALHGGVGESDGLRGALNADGLADFIARSIVTGPFEWSPHPVTMFKAWQTVPAGECVLLDRAGALQRRIRIDAVIDAAIDGYQDRPACALQAAAAVRDAVDERLRALAANAPLASDFSGGVDSAIIRARCLAVAPTRYAGSVTCQFPYPEFAREAQMRAAVLLAQPGRVQLVDHRRYLPFAGLDEIISHDAPTLASTAWGAITATVQAAQAMQAGILLNGHGGDTLFRLQPGSAVEYALPNNLKDCLRPALRADVAERTAAIAQQLNRRHGSWNPAMIAPSQPQKLVLAGHPQMRYESGFMDREVLRSCATLWRAQPTLAAVAQKPVAHAAFGDDLPAALWHRPSKVDHLGIVYRGAMAARATILAVFERNADALAQLGCHPRYLVKLADNASRGLDAGNFMFSVLLSIALWLDQVHTPGRLPPPTQAYALEGDMINMNESEVCTN